MIKKLSLILAVSFFISFFSSNTLQAKEKDTFKWKNVGPWEVRIDKTLDFGCFLYAIYEGGTAVRIGFDVGRDSAYLMLGDIDWESIEVGKDYNITMQFDDEVPWEVKATAIRMGYPFLMAYTKQWDFFKEFGRKHYLSVKYKKQEIALLKLNGSAAAVKELLNCQTAVTDVRKNIKKDPFSGSGSVRTKDPFKQPENNKSKDPFRF